MDTKLTLKLDKKIIEKAKQYAQDKNISLSKLIENMLSKVTDSRKFKSEVTPLVDSLSGLINAKDLESNDYRNYLDEKYQ